MNISSQLIILVINGSRHSCYGIGYDFEGKPTLMLGKEKKWQIGQYSTPSINTGPMGDHTLANSKGTFYLSPSGCIFMF